MQQRARPGDPDLGPLALLPGIWANIRDPNYEQAVAHIETEDFPESQLKQPLNATIHHEPGLFLFMKNQTDGPIDIARLGTIPHGDALLALGDSEPPAAGAPVIPDTNGLPIDVDTSDVAGSAYLAPYQHFIANPFCNLFRPDQTSALLQASLGALGPVRETTTLHFSSTVATGGINNIPFVVNQANATEIESTFWILELEELGMDGQPRLIMLYHQVVMLEFFERRDGTPGLIKWPHVSINTMERLPEKPEVPLESSEISYESI